MSHCDTRVPIEAINFLSQKIFIFNFFSKQVFFMFQDYEISFSEKKFPTFKCIVTSQSPAIAMRFQRRKLPFACNQRRRNLPVRIAWQGAGAWVSHCDTRVPIEAINFLSQKIFIFNFFSKQVFFMFQDYEISFSEKKFPTFKCIVTSQGPAIAMRFQRRKLPFACNQRRRTLVSLFGSHGKGPDCRSLGVSLRYESTNRGQKFSMSKIFGKPKNKIISIKFQNYI